jgi:hypothetical protein
MRKGVIVVLIAAAALLFVSAVYAFPPGNGKEICRSGSVDTEAYPGTLAAPRVVAGCKVKV